MPAYVPPQQRKAQEGGGGDGGDSKPAREERPADRDGGRKGGRGGDDRDDGGRKGGGGGGGGGGGKGGGGGARANNSVFAGAACEGGDWKKRDDGRRPGGYNLTELEVFGETSGKNTSGIDFDSYDNIPVQITGNDVQDIKPINRFSEAKLTDSLADNLRRCGYERPTPVQKNSIPIVISGRDLMACAQTGSGKTCAFMVPCLESLLRSGPPANPGSRSRPKPMPCGLVLAPTRELAAQIHVESTKFSFDTGIRACIIYGGADMREQRSELEKGCDILIATPGRLTDMYERGFTSLELIQFFILDEADRMLDMGFEPQVRQIVEKTGLGSKSRFPRQNMMFSATFPREVQRMAQDFMNDYVFITVGRVGSASELIQQKVVYAAETKAKVRNLENAIKENLPKGGLAVIFVETKKSADSLELDLHTSGVAVTAIHGDRSQSEREEALHAFKSGSNPVLVATDVAARGLDIPNVALVVNFDMPKQIDDYVHRIGRTGRAGRKGVAVSFVNERCTYLPELGDLLVEAKQDPPDWFRELCGSALNRVGKGKGRGAPKFGGQDLRLESGGPAATNPGLAKAPSQSWSTPVRQAGSHGITGAADAWDD